VEPDSFAVVGVEREKEFFIPEGGSVEVRRGDLVYLFGDEERIKALCPRLEVEAPERIERCVVFGGGDLGIPVARKLIEHGKEVKIVEEDLKQCP
jgi:trk system potassium uptake protein TrkA